MTTPTPTPGSPRPDKQGIIAALTAASVQNDAGRRYVRASVARKIMSLPTSQIGYWEKSGRLHPKRFPVMPKRRIAPDGIVVALPLDELIVLFSKLIPKPTRHWTQREDDSLLDHYGSLPDQIIAGHLNRTVRAVQRRVTQLGLSRAACLGLLTPAQAAKICNRSCATINYWISRGLRSRRAQGDDRTHLIDPVDLFRFLHNRPSIWNRLSKRSRHCITLMGFDVGSGQGCGPRCGHKEVA